MKPVTVRLRFTSNVAEFTDATWTTGYRRNASSKKNTTKATMRVPNANELAILFNVLRRQG
jgi:hypothetical protein